MGWRFVINVFKRVDRSICFVMTTQTLLFSVYICFWSYQELSLLVLSIIFFQTVYNVSFEKLMLNLLSLFGCRSTLVGSPMGGQSSDQVVNGMCTFASDSEICANVKVGCLISLNCYY